MLTEIYLRFPKSLNVNIQPSERELIDVTNCATATGIDRKNSTTDTYFSVTKCYFCCVLRIPGKRHDGQSTLMFKSSPRKKKHIYSKSTSYKPVIYAQNHEMHGKQTLNTQWTKNEQVVNKRKNGQVECFRDSSIKFN